MGLRTNWIKWGLAGLLVLLALGFIVLKLRLNAYLQSDDFRQLLTRRTEAALQVTGTYLPLQWTGWAVYSDGFAGQGPAVSPIQSIRADQIRADLELRGFYHRRWEIPNLQLQRLRLTLNRAGQFTPPAAAPTEPHHSRWGSDRFVLSQISVQETELRWDEHGYLTGTRLTLRPVEDAWELTGSLGKLLQDDLTPLTIEQFKLRYRAAHLYVTEALFKLAESGRLALSGDIDLGPAGKTDLRITARNIPVEQVVPPDWRARLAGQVAGEATLTGPIDAPEQLVASGTIHLQPGTLRALPILDRLATFTGTEQFREVALQQATADFHWSPAHLNVTNLVLESQGLLRIEGGFTVAQRELTGVFEVGVSAATLRWLPGSREKVFTTDRGGYLWTTVHVTGPVDQLREDLSARLAGAATEEIIEGTRRTLEQGARGVLELLRPLLP
jgi:hypothetical protein